MTQRIRFQGLPSVRVNHYLTLNLLSLTIRNTIIRKEIENWYRKDAWDINIYHNGDNFGSHDYKPQAILATIELFFLYFFLPEGRSRSFQKEPWSLVPLLMTSARCSVKFLCQYQTFHFMDKKLSTNLFSVYPVDSHPPYHECHPCYHQPWCPHIIDKRWAMKGEQISFREFFSCYELGIWAHKTHSNYQQFQRIYKQFWLPDHA